jgi:hypothetical protein
VVYEIDQLRFVLSRSTGQPGLWGQKTNRTFARSRTRDAFFFSDPNLRVCFRQFERMVRVGDQKSITGDLAMLSLWSIDASV